MSSSLWFLFIADFFGAALLPEDAALPPVSSAQRTALLAAISEGKKIHYGTGLHSRRTSHFLEATDKPVAGPRDAERAAMRATIADAIRGRGQLGNGAHHKSITVIR